MSRSTHLWGGARFPVLVRQKGQTVLAILHRLCKIENNQRSLPHLPADILREIFSALLDLCLGWDQSYQCLLSVSQVCSTWRDAGLGDSRLWARVLNPNDPCPARFNETLSRVKQTPFPITSTMGHRRSYPLRHRQWLLLFSQMARITDIKLELLQATTRDDEFCLVEMLEDPAPSLESLIISCFRKDRPFAILHSRRKGMFFNGKAATLRTLTLHNCIIIPMATSFPNLTRLNLTCSARETDIAYLLAWWNMCCSGKLPSIETLVIEGITFSSSFPVNRCSATQGAMPYCLRRIQLTGDLDACTWLLDREGFALPSSCDLRLSVTGPTWPPGFIADEEIPDSVCHPERVLDELLSNMWRLDTSPCLKFILSGSHSMFEHRSAVRTISIFGETSGSGGKAAFCGVMRRLIRGDIISKLNLNQSWYCSEYYLKPACVRDSHVKYTMMIRY